MNQEIAIKVENISKTFRIPHEKISTLKGAFLSAFKTKSYEKFKALDDISFEVKKGEFFGIIGRNGSGKTTLLKILAGIYQPDGGNVKIDGLISPFLELGIGFNPELSGRDNIYLNAAVLGLSHKQIDEKFDDIVNFSELRRFIDQKVKNYSSGMQVRLMFSVAIHANREILLMDEVLAVGDTNFQSKCMEEFNKYKNAGKTVILVTHDIATVQRYCDRAMLLREGKIEMIGDPEKVGNEYIFQNMSDEEKRMLEEEKMKADKSEKENEEKKRGTGKEKKAKAAEITRIDFLNKEGDIKNVFTTGEDMSIKVYFKRKMKLDVLNYSLTIHNHENDYFFGINSFIDKVDLGKCFENNSFQINFFRIPLQTNIYYVKAEIFGENEVKNYDYFQKKIRVMSKSKSHGLVEIKYNWQ